MLSPRSLFLSVVISSLVACGGGGGGNDDDPGAGSPPEATPAPTPQVTPAPESLIDTDNDGVVDINDTDDDGDGVLDAEDAFPLDASESVDTDGDGVGNNADTDDDGDGVGDEEDVFPLDGSETVDTDGDGVGDNSDNDNDNDGVSDGDDAFPFDPNESQDSDGDGVGDNRDAYANDPACFVEGDGNGSQCYFTWMRDQQIHHKVLSNTGILYLYASGWDEIYRYSLVDSQFLSSFSLHEQSSGVSGLAYSASHERLYLSFLNGEIKYVDADGGIKDFATISTGASALVSVGHYVLAQQHSDTQLRERVVFNRAGEQTDQDYWGTYSVGYAWNPENSRLYYFSGGQHRLSYLEVDQLTGNTIDNGETSRYSELDFIPPILVSKDGRYVLLGSGSLYNIDDNLSWAGSAGESLDDALWLADGTLLTLRYDVSTNSTVLARLPADLRRVEERVEYSGEALGIYQVNGRIMVLLRSNTALSFVEYVSNSDMDGDGVENHEDDFPSDASASLDSDGDGYPDAWNEGYSEADSTENLRLDSYPEDPSCYLASQGDGESCDYNQTVPNFVADQVVSDGNGILYLLSREDGRVYRWSVAANSYLKPLSVGFRSGFRELSPLIMAYSESHDRLYLGYEDGAINFINMQAPDVPELLFTDVGEAVHRLLATGDYVFAAGDEDDWSSARYIFDQNGEETHSDSWNDGASSYYWSASDSRLYFTWFSELHYLVIDQGSGQFGTGDIIRHDDGFNPWSFIKASSDGSQLIVSSGSLYLTEELAWNGSLGENLSEALWLSDNTLAAVRYDDVANVSNLTRFNAVNSPVESLNYDGRVRGMYATAIGNVILIEDDGEYSSIIYTPNNDSDGDGVVNEEDAFPIDIAASIDADKDGYPDAWNDGYDENDSSTSLVLDSYPEDADCYLLEQGDGNTCDYSRVISDVRPHQIISDGDDTLYLLNRENKRVYRWSVEDSTYTKSIAVGITTGFIELVPTIMTYSSTHDRLYLGYENGVVRYIDMAQVNEAFEEIPYVDLEDPIIGLTTVGDYVFVQKGFQNSSNRRYLFDADGQSLDSESRGGSTRTFVWNEASSRLYYLYHEDLRYQVIDEDLGEFGAEFDTDSRANGGNYYPLSVAPEAEHVVVGSGNIYTGDDFEWKGSLGEQINHALWLQDGSLVIARYDSEGPFTYEVLRLDSDFNMVERIQYDGEVLGLFETATGFVVFVNTDDTFHTHTHVPNDDVDNDGVANDEDAFPFDVAASVDTDADGYPDEWNVGYDSSDSTSGLVLDSYPLQLDCYLLEHGDGDDCDYNTVVPEFIPDQIVSDGTDIIYLLSRENGRVYRWSTESSSYISPLAVGFSLGSRDYLPQKMAYSPEQRVLYFSYENSDISKIDLDVSTEELPFTRTTYPVSDLVAADDYLIAQESYEFWPYTLYVFDQSGVEVFSEDWAGDSVSGYVWSAADSRIYYTRYTDLRYRTFDLESGVLGYESLPPDNSLRRGVSSPIRVSIGGEYILTGRGDIYQGPDLSWVTSLDIDIVDALWFEEVLVTVTSDESNDSHIQIWSNNDFPQAYTDLSIEGQPLAFAKAGDDIVLVHREASGVNYTLVEIGDNDEDGMPAWWENLYGLDDDDELDAALDSDNDEITNVEEYILGTSPLLEDSDGDGLDDATEVNDTGSNPTLSDSDEDGLNDGEEVNDHGSDPNLVDSDSDGFTDGEEVLLYLTDPTDPESLPDAIRAFTQSFEDDSWMALWREPSESNAAWAQDDSRAADGVYSLRSGEIGDSHSSAVQFEGLFASGTLSFQVQIDAESCCDSLTFLVDGDPIQSWRYISDDAWANFEIELNNGQHVLEWRYSKDGSVSHGEDAAWIDNIRFEATP